MKELVFNVTIDDDGNYCAHAKAGNSDLFTDGRTLQELESAIREVIALYSEEKNVVVNAYSLRFDITEVVPA